MKTTRKASRNFIQKSHLPLRRKPKKNHTAGRAAIRKLEKLSPTLVNALPDALILTDCAGSITYASLRALELFGCSRIGELVGKNLARLISPKERRRMATVLQAAADGNSMVDSRIQALKKNGKPFIGEFNAAPYKNPAGAVKGIIVITRDITEREQNENSLRESEEKFRTLADKLPNMVFINKKGRIVYTNEKSVEVLGYSLAEFYSPDFNFLVLTAPEHHASEKRNFRRHKEEKEVPPHEYTLLTKDGRRIDAIIETTLIRYEGETAILGIVTDITERKQNESILRESERRFKSILDTVHLVSVVLERDGTVSFCNDYLLKITGYARSEVIGGNWFKKFLPQDEAEKVKKIFFELMPAGKLPHYFENSIITRDGERRSIRWNNTVLRDHTNVIVGSASIGEDVTDRIQAEEAMRLAQKMESLGVLAGGIAHDFNNLLHAILGQHHLALRKLPLGSPARDNVEKAQKAADRASDLTQKLLAYSGRGKFDMHAVDLGSFILDSVHLLEVAIPKNVGLSLERVESRRIIEADIAQLQQVVMNLVINAGESVEDRIGLIRVAVYEALLTEADLKNWTSSDEGISAGDYVILEVNDNGAGMDPHIVHRIFDPFFTTKFTGRGLGLAAVLGIVRGHKAGIQVTSTSGCGTTFRIAFPASHAPVPVDSRPRKALTRPVLSGKILIIDDEAGVREVFSNVFADYGIKVVTAENGEDGLRKFSRERDAIALVLLDLSMPGMGGEETFRQLKKIDPDAKIVLSSGYTEEDATRKFGGLGLAGFIHKPYEWDNIEDIITRLFK